LTVSGDFLDRRAAVRRRKQEKSPFLPFRCRKVFQKKLSGKGPGILQPGYILCNLHPHKMTRILEELH
jgi:hypothetical protein